MESGSKVCRDCEQRKPCNEFGKYTRAKDGLNVRCLICAASAARVWRDNHIQNARKAVTDWQARNPGFRYSENSVETTRRRLRRHAARRRAKLTDAYIVSLLTDYDKTLKRHQIPPEIIQAKREQLSLRRLEKELKQVLNELEK